MTPKPVRKMGPFEEALDVLKLSDMPGLREACIQTHRALCIARASAIEAFKEQAKPEHMIEIAKIILDQRERSLESDFEEE